MHLCLYMVGLEKRHLIFTSMVIVIAFWASCKSSAPQAQAQEEAPMKDKMEVINMKAKEMMEGKFMLSPNQDSSMWLCTKEEIPTTYFGVIHEDGHIILEKKGIQGTVEWHDISSLITTSTPGRIEIANKRRTKIIHLNQG